MFLGGIRVARPRTVFGFVSPARLETCENIVRIGLAFLGLRWPAGLGLGCGVWPRLGKNRSTPFLGQATAPIYLGRSRTQAAPQLPLPPARSYKTVGSWLAQACASLCASACLQRRMDQVCAGAVEPAVVFLAFGPHPGRQPSFSAPIMLVGVDRQSRASSAADCRG